MRHCCFGLKSCGEVGVKAEREDFIFMFCFKVALALVFDCFMRKGFCFCWSVVCFVISVLTSWSKLCQLISLPPTNHEHITNKHLNDPHTWAALLHRYHWAQQVKSPCVIQKLKLVCVNKDPFLLYELVFRCFVQIYIKSSLILNLICFNPDIRNVTCLPFISCENIV